MSQINDALKQARKVPPRNTPSALPPLPPTGDEPSALAPWLLPAIVILLLVGAIFFTGWAVAHRTVNEIVAAPDSEAKQSVAPLSAPAKFYPVPDEPKPLNPPDAPKLQGIFYSATAPSAIIDGKTVHPGDKTGSYRVKEISKNTVTLVGPDKKEIKIGMTN